MKGHFKRYVVKCTAVRYMKIEKSRRVEESRPVNLGLKNQK